MPEVDFMEQISEAKAEVRQAKKYCPHLLPEYQALMRAAQDVVDAEQRLKEAQAAWDRLGN